MIAIFRGPSYGQDEDEGEYWGGIALHGERVADAEGRYVLRSEDQWHVERVYDMLATDLMRASDSDIGGFIQALPDSLMTVVLSHDLRQMMYLRKHDSERERQHAIEVLTRALKVEIGVGDTYVHAK